MGNFAVGGLVTVGILGATAIFAKFYDVMTKGAREARKEADELTKSLVAQAKAAFQATQQGAQWVALAAEQNLANVKKESGVGLRSLILGRLDPADAKAQADRVSDAQLAVNQAWANVGKIVENNLPPIKKNTTAVDGLKDSYNDLREAIEKTRKAVDDEGKAWWTNFIMKMHAQDELTKILGPILDVNVNPAGRPLTDFGTTISGVDTDIGLTKEQIKTRDALIGNADKNAQLIQSAVLQSAQIIGSVVSQALNVGGGGRGSQIAGSIGAIVGGAAGSLLGPAGAVITSALGGAVGSVIGGLAGSLLGGLFDSNKKAVNTNTQALYANTAALLLHAPQGYSVAAGRHNATDVKEWRRDVQRFRTRGGAPILAGT